MISFTKGHSQNSKGMEKGSVMLEVIAVLALMGVMGAMLFRQIYQRNQELHNIQMASEIRAVKEAFSAYIQANRSDLLDVCEMPTEDNSAPQCLPTELSADAYSNTLASEIKTYLPDGWFDGNTLKDYYHFTLWNYIQNDTTQKRIIYGIIAPTEETIPQSGWNFKRAARVALLIGADGGVYASGITDDESCTGNRGIAGALNTWHLCQEDTGALNNSYVAMTAMDIFTPEFELPEGRTAFQADLSLGVNQLHAWQNFAAGGTQDNRDNCFTVNHNRVEGIDPPMVVNDNLNGLDPTSTCSPLFVVDGMNGQVFVNNDLEIGANGSANVTIRQEGPIVFSATANDPQKSGNTTSYLLDPKFTSVMNDVKVMSRGGAKLSEILPTYILKTQQSVETGDTVDIPSCPTGYAAALTVFPVSWNQSATTKLKNNGSEITTSANGDFPVKVSDDLPVTGAVNDITEKMIAPSSGGYVSLEAGKTLDISGAVDKDNVESKVKADLSKLSATTTVTHGICVKITRSGETDSTSGRMRITGLDDTKKWTVILGYNNTEGNCTTANDTGKTIKAIAQTYCVWMGAINSTATDRARSTDAEDWKALKAKIGTEQECRSYGGRWNSGVCEDPT